MHRLLVVAGLVVFVVGCRNQDEAGAIALWEDFQAAEYRSWERAPGFPGLMPSTASHGDAVEIFINDTLVEALASGDKLTVVAGGVADREGRLQERRAVGGGGDGAARGRVVLGRV
jgi:hypothetical protein